MRFKNTVEEQLEWGRFNVTYARKDLSLIKNVVCDQMQRCPSPPVTSLRENRLVKCTECIGSIRYADLGLPTKPEGSWNTELIPWGKEVKKKLKVIEVLNL